MRIGTGVDIEKVWGEIRNAGNRLLAQAVAKAAAGGCQAERMLIESAKDRRVAETIADGARDWRADLVVVGTHGRHGFERMLVGSVAKTWSASQRPPCCSSGSIRCHVPSAPGAPSTGCD